MKNISNTNSNHAPYISNNKVYACIKHFLPSTDLLSDHCKNRLGDVCQSYYRLVKYG